MSLRRGLTAVAAVALSLSFASPAGAQGGCGSVCIPLEVIDPERADISAKKFRLIVTTEYADFHAFKVHDDKTSNPAMNRADIHNTTVILDYGVTDRVTLSVLLPYVRKIQHNRAFGRRAAEGIGDVSLFGRYRFTRKEAAASVVGSLGVKFPTGSVEEPGGGIPNLPQPFQTGSGAYDAVPSLSYFQTFDTISLFGGAFARIPLEENKFDYEFGKEYEAHFGVVLPVSERVELLLSLDWLHAERDEDGLPCPGACTAPPPFHDGAEVLNTGGNFLDATPGLRIRAGKNTTLQARFFIPVLEDWNGSASVTAGPLMQPAGQVAPDLTTQLSLIHTFR